MDDTTSYRLAAATLSDRPAWMAFVASVAEAFPWLEPPDVYEGKLVGHIAREEALCIKDGDRVIGVTLVDRRENRILCLAVSPDYRRCGLATRLLIATVEGLDRRRAVTVRTFRADDPRGVAPRALYARCGFTEGALGRRGGYPVQTFILPADKGENV